MGLHSGEETWPPASSRAPQTGPCPLASRRDRGGVREGHRNHSRTKDETDGHGSRKVFGRPWEEVLESPRGPRCSAAWNRLAGRSHQPLSQRCGERRPLVTETLLPLSLGSAGSQDPSLPPFLIRMKHTRPCCPFTKKLRPRTGGHKERSPVMLFEPWSIWAPATSENS